MLLKGYDKLKIIGPHSDGGTILYHPDCGEVHVSYFNYNVKEDLWEIKLFKYKNSNSMNN